MEPFIRSDQYHLIIEQIKIIVSGHASVNDTKVLAAQKAMCHEKVLNAFGDINDEKKQLLSEIIKIEDKTQAEIFSEKLMSFVIPFEKLTDEKVKKLFPKVKKLKAPIVDDIDHRELSYLSWIDNGSKKKFLVARYKDKLVGIHGTYDHAHQKGICTLCGKYEEVGLFVSHVKGAVKDVSISRGNYICQDSIKCNQNMTSLKKLNEFLARLEK